MNLIVLRATKLLAPLSAALLLATAFARADEAEIARLLKDKGLTVSETKGVVTGVAAKEAGKLTDADFQMIGQLAHLKTLDLNDGLTDARLAMLTGLGALEYLQTNRAQLTDDGCKPLAKLQSLRTVKFFHPGKEFSGAGLVHLADLPHLQQLTVAGSLAFNDDGLAAVAQLTRLQDFRTWHAGGTDEGVKKLKDLPNLKGLNLGQRLTYKAPASPTDETLALLVELKSLETLQLSEARLTLSALQKLKQLPALKKLILDGIELPPADLERLKAELPRVTVEWSAPNDAYRKRIQALFGKE
ncbi:MAG: hypothetical protein JNM56_01195 [Planctomycetia bacterium]|nr:hypothetical protein [Planctomycetia bacterium]